MNAEEARKTPWYDPRKRNLLFLSFGLGMFTFAILFMGLTNLQPTIWPWWPQWLTSPLFVYLILLGIVFISSFVTILPFLFLAKKIEKLHNQDMTASSS